MGSPITLTPQLQSSIIAALESGATVRAVAAKHNVSDAWIFKQVSLNQEFREQYARALDIRTDVDHEQLIESLEESPAMTEHGIDSAWVQLKRLKVDTIKWSLSKRNPKKYGESSKVELSGEVNIGLAERISKARKRVESK